MVVDAERRKYPVWEIFSHHLNKLASQTWWHLGALRRRCFSSTNSLSQSKSSSFPYALLLCELFFIIPIHRTSFWFRSFLGDKTADALTTEGWPSDRKLHLFLFLLGFFFFSFSVSFFTSLYGKFQYERKKTEKKTRSSILGVEGASFRFLVFFPRRIFSPFNGMKLILSVDYWNWGVLFHR